MEKKKKAELSHEEIRKAAVRDCVKMLKNKERVGGRGRGEVERSQVDCPSGR